MTLSIPFGNIFNPQQYASIPPRCSGTVFYGKIPDSCIGFISTIATLVWYPSVTYLIEIDGAGFTTIQREIDITNPYVYPYNQQVVVKNKIEVIATNSSTATYTLGFMVDGVAYHRESALAIL